MAMAVDLENDPSTLGAIAASAAVHISGLPWKGPVSVLNVGIKGGKYLVNQFIQIWDFDLDLLFPQQKKQFL